MPADYEFDPAFLQALGVVDQTVQQQAAPSAVERLGYHVATAPFKAVEGLANSVETIFGMPKSRLIDPKFNLAPAQTTAQHVADFAGGLIPMGLELALTGGAVRAGAGALGLVGETPRAIRALRTAEDVAGFGMLGAQEDRTTGVEQAGEGAAIAQITSRFGRMDPRRWLAAAALGLGSKAFFDRNGGEKIAGDWTRGDIAGAATGISTALFGAPVRPPKPIIPDHFTQWGEKGKEIALAPEFNRPRPEPEWQNVGKYDNTYRPDPVDAELVTNPMLIGYGGSDRPITRIGDFNQPMTEAQVYQRIPWRHEVQTPPFSNIPHEVPKTLEQAMWEPSMAAQIQRLGSPGAPTLEQGQQALQQLQMALLTREARSNEMLRRIAWARFYNDIFDRPNNGMGSRSVLEPEDAWREMILKGSDKEAPQLTPPPALSPLPEVDLIGTQKGKPVIPEAELQSLQNNGPVNEAYLEAQREAARRGRMQDLPEYKRTQGGNTIGPSVNALARGAVGAVAGYGIGEYTDQDNPWVLAAVMGFGAAAGPEVVARLMARERTPLQTQIKNTEPPKFRSSVTPTNEASPELKAFIAERKADQAATAEQLTEAQREAARRGRLQDLPEYRRSEGGSVDPDVLRTVGLPVARGIAGGAFTGTAAALDGDPDTDPTLAAVLGAGAFGLGPIVGREIIAAAQRAKGGVAHPFINEAGGIANPFHEGIPGGFKVDKQITPDEIRLSVGTDVREYGYLAANENNGRLQIHGSGINQSLRGKKFGIHLYDQMADEAAARGIPLASDTSVSKEAANVWYALERRGYRLERDPEAYFLESRVGEGSWVSSNGKPVFTLHPPEKSLQPLQNTSSPSGMKMSGGTEGGFVFPELRAAMGRAAVTGFIGGSIGGMTDEPGEHGGFIKGAMIGAAAGALGPAMARSLIDHLSGAKTFNLPRGNWASNLVKNWGQIIEEKAGAAFRGRGTVSDRFVRALDQGFELTMPTEVKRVLSEAKGVASVLLDRMDSALLKVSLRYNPDDAVKGIANQYLDGAITQQQFLQQLQSHIVRDARVGDYAQFLITARESVNGLQKMLRDGVGDPKMRNIIDKSIGKYLTRSYKLFTDSRWIPEASKLDAVVDEIHTAGVWPGATKDDIRVGLEQYVREAKTIKGIYKVSGSPIGQAINQAALKERKQLSTAWREFLGEITDPTERVYQTVFRIRPMAESAKYFNDLARVDVDGLPQVFNSYADRDAFKNGLLHKLATVAKGSPEELKINKQLTSLESFQNVDSHPKFGALQGTIVSRHVWDTLKTFDSMTTLTDHPFLRGVSNLHTTIKLTRTAFNPITVVRNFATAPMFMAIGRAHVNDITEAVSIIRDPNHKLRSEIMAQGIGNVDQVRTEFFKEFENITGGKYGFGTVDLTNWNMGKIDLDLGEKIARRGIRGVLDIYRLPDNMIRIGTYLSAKRRIAEALGKAMDDPTVIQKATDFTNRYTMNYDTIAPAVKGLRQVPFFNLFMSYTAEMARIGKNLMEDVIKGGDGLTSHDRMWAMMPLATLAFVPAMMESWSESNLTEKDKADWNKAKKLLPDYSRTRYRWVTGRDPKTKQFHYIDFTPLIASDAFNQMERAIRNKDWEALAAVNPLVGWENTPVFNIATSMMTGADLHTKREFRPFDTAEGQMDRIATIAKEILPPWTPSVGSEAYRFGQAYSINAQGQRGITNMRTGVRITPADVWMPYFSGVRPGSANLGALVHKAQQQAKHDVANQIAYLNDVLKSDLPEERKRQAYEQAKLALATIREEYRAKLGATE